MHLASKVPHCNVIAVGHFIVVSYPKTYETCNITACLPANKS